MVMNDEFRRKLSNTHQDELQRYFSSYGALPNFEPESGIVAIDKGSPAHSGVETQYVISKVGDKDMDNDLGEKELLTYEVKNNLFTQSLQVSATEHTPSVMKDTGEKYEMWHVYDPEPFLVPKEGKVDTITGFPSLSQEEVESELTVKVLQVSYSLREPYYPEIARNNSFPDSKLPRKGTGGY